MPRIDHYASTLGTKNVFESVTVTIVSILTVFLALALLILMVPLFFGWLFS